MPSRRNQSCRTMLFAASLAPMVLAGTAVAAKAPPAGLKPLLGSWRVVGVRVAPAPVQALAPNDPSLMGAILDVTPHRLSWRQPHRSTSLDVECDGPRLTGDRIACRRGDFAPPGSKLFLRAKRLTIEWYDGGTLLLTRIGR